MAEQEAIAGTLESFRWEHDYELNELTEAVKMVKQQVIASEDSNLESLLRLNRETCVRLYMIKKRKKAAFEFYNRARQVLASKGFAYVGDHVELVDKARRKLDEILVANLRHNPSLELSEAMAAVDGELRRITAQFDAAAVMGKLLESVRPVAATDTFHAVQREKPASKSSSKLEGDSHKADDRVCQRSTVETSHSHGIRERVQPPTSDTLRSAGDQPCKRVNKRSHESADHDSDQSRGKVERFVRQWRGVTGSQWDQAQPSTAKALPPTAGQACEKVPKIDHSSNVSQGNSKNTRWNQPTDRTNQPETQSNRSSKPFSRWNNMLRLVVNESADSGSADCATMNLRGCGSENAVLSSVKEEPVINTDVPLSELLMSEVARVRSEIESVEALESTEQVNPVGDQRLPESGATSSETSKNIVSLNKSLCDIERLRMAIVQLQETIATVSKGDANALVSSKLEPNDYFSESRVSKSNLGPKLTAKELAQQVKKTVSKSMSKSGRHFTAAELSKQIVASSSSSEVELKRREMLEVIVELKEKLIELQSLASDNTSRSSGSIEFSPAHNAKLSDSTNAESGYKSQSWETASGSFFSDAIGLKRERSRSPEAVTHKRFHVSESRKLPKECANNSEGREIAKYKSILHRTTSKVHSPEYDVRDKDDDDDCRSDLQAAWLKRVERSPSSSRESDVSGDQWEITSNEESGCAKKRKRYCRGGDNDVLAKIEQFAGKCVSKSADKMSTQSLQSKLPERSNIFNICGNSSDYKELMRRVSMEIVTENDERQKSDINKNKVVENGDKQSSDFKTLLNRIRTRKRPSPAAEVNELKAPEPDASGIHSKLAAAYAKKEETNTSCSTRTPVVTNAKSEIAGLEGTYTNELPVDSVSLSHLAALLSSSEADLLAAVTKLPKGREKLNKIFSKLKKANHLRQSSVSEPNQQGFAGAAQNLPFTALSLSCASTMSTHAPISTPFVTTQQQQAPNLPDQPPTPTYAGTQQSNIAPDKAQMLFPLLSELTPAEVQHLHAPIPPPAMASQSHEFDLPFGALQSIVTPTLSPPPSLVLPPFNVPPPPLSTSIFSPLAPYSSTQTSLSNAFEPYIEYPPHPIQPLPLSPAAPGLYAMLDHYSVESNHHAILEHHNNQESNHHAMLEHHNEESSHLAMFNRHSMESVGFESNQHIPEFASGDGVRMSEHRDTINLPAAAAADASGEFAEVPASGDHEPSEPWMDGETAHLQSDVDKLQRFAATLQPSLPVAAAVAVAETNATARLLLVSERKRAVVQFMDQSIKNVHSQRLDYAEFEPKVADCAKMFDMLLRSYLVCDLSQPLSQWPGSVRHQASIVLDEFNGDRLSPHLNNIDRIRSEVKDALEWTLINEPVTGEEEWFGPELEEALERFNELKIAAENARDGGEILQVRLELAEAERILEQTSYRRRCVHMFQPLLRSELERIKGEKRFRWMRFIPRILNSELRNVFALHRGDVQSLTTTLFDVIAQRLFLSRVQYALSSFPFSADTMACELDLQPEWTSVDQFLDDLKSGGSQFLAAASRFDPRESDKTFDGSFVASGGDSVAARNPPEPRNVASRSGPPARSAFPAPKQSESSSEPAENTGKAIPSQSDRSSPTIPSSRQWFQSSLAATSDTNEVIEKPHLPSADLALESLRNPTSRPWFQISPSFASELNETSEKSHSPSDDLSPECFTETAIDFLLMQAGEAPFPASATDRFIAMQFVDRFKKNMLVYFMSRAKSEIQLAGCSLMDFESELGTLVRRLYEELFACLNPYVIEDQSQFRDIVMTVMTKYADIRKLLNLTDKIPCQPMEDRASPRYASASACEVVEVVTDTPTNDDIGKRLTGFSIQMIPDIHQETFDAPWDDDKLSSLRDQWRGLLRTAKMLLNDDGDGVDHLMALERTRTTAFQLIAQYETLKTRNIVVHLFQDVGASRLCGTPSSAAIVEMLRQSVDAKIVAVNGANLRSGEEGLMQFRAALRDAAQSVLTEYQFARFLGSGDGDGDDLRSANVSNRAAVSSGAADDSSEPVNSPRLAVNSLIPAAQNILPTGMKNYKRAAESEKTLNFSGVLGFNGTEVSSTLALDNIQSASKANSTVESQTAPTSLFVLRRSMTAAAKSSCVALSSISQDGQSEPALSADRPFTSPETSATSPSAIGASVPLHHGVSQSANNLELSLPVNAVIQCPTALLHKRCRAVYADAVQIGRHPNVEFVQRVTVAGKTYMASARTKEEAKQEAAHKACVALFGME